MAGDLGVILEFHLAPSAASCCTARAGPEVEGSLQSVLGNEDLDGVLFDHEDVPLLVPRLVLEEKVGVEVDRRTAGILSHPGMWHKEVNSDKTS